MKLIFKPVILTIMNYSAKVCSGFIFMLSNRENRVVWVIYCILVVLQLHQQIYEIFACIYISAGSIWNLRLLGSIWLGGSILSI